MFRHLLPMSAPPAALALVVAMAPQALATGTSNRAWVSGKGTDAAGCGAPTNACRSFQYVHDNIIAAGGEIDVLDPAGYGAVKISKALSIVNDGVGTAGVQATSSGQTAITINAGASDSITLRGLNIDGLNAGADGVGLSSAGALTIVNCVVRHFTHDGIYLQPTSALKLSIINTIAADNGNDGFDLSPSSGGSIKGVINGSTAINNSQNGVSLWAVNTNYNLLLTVTKSDLSNNGGDGLYAIGNNNAYTSNLQAVVRDTVANFNTVGFYADANSGIYLTNTTANNNSTYNVASPTGTTYSFGDNVQVGVVGAIFGTIVTQSKY